MTVVVVCVLVITNYDVVLLSIVGVKVRCFCFFSQSDWFELLFFFLSFLFFFYVHMFMRSVNMFDMFEAYTFKNGANGWREREHGQNQNQINIDDQSQQENAIADIITLLFLSHLPTTARAFAFERLVKE